MCDCLGMSIHPRHSTDRSKSLCLAEADAAEKDLQGWVRVRRGGEADDDDGLWGQEGR